MNLEPLEDRKMLTVAQVYVDDNWVSVDGGGNPNGLALFAGSTVRNLNDTINPGGLTKTYGTDAFGIGSDGSFVAADKTISSAVSQVTPTTGTLNILEGTYKESDIVINSNITVSGAGQSGLAQTLIEPEVASTPTIVGGGDNEFAAGSHQGFIIYGASVTIKNVHLDGSANTSLVGGFNYHQGITTMYDQQAGVDYAALHGAAGGAPTTLPPTQMGVPGDGRTNRTLTSYLVSNVTVDNVYYHGITLSAPAGKEYGQSSGTSPNTVFNSIVNNVGDTVGNQDLNRVGILIQNFDNFPTSFVPSAIQFNADFDTVTNVGVGLKTSFFGTYGVNAFLGDNATLGSARNKTAFSSITVNDPVVRGFEMDMMENSGPVGNSTVNISAPKIATNNTVGFYYNRSNAIATNDTVNGALVGIEIQNDGYADNGASKDDMVALAIKFTLNGPAQRAGSVGVLSVNDANNPLPSSFIMSTGFQVHNYETGIKVNQAVPVPATVLVGTRPGDGGPTTYVNVAANAPTTVSIDRPVISGNLTGFNFGTNVQVIGNFTTPDPIVGSSSTTYQPGFGTRTTNFAYAISNFVTPFAGGPAAQPTIVTPAPNSSDSFTSNNLTLAAGDVFKPQLVQTLSDVTLNDFSSAVNYPASTQSNPWRTGFTATGTFNTWFGAVTQDGITGTIVVDPLGGNTTENGLAYGPLPAPVDLRGYQTLNVVARLLPGNGAKLFAVAIASAGGLGYDYFMDTTGMHVSTGSGDTVFSTMTINLLAPSVRANKGDNVFDFSNITAFGIITDGGFVDGNINTPVGLEIDRVFASSSLTAGEFNVTSGNVSLNNATLAASIFSGFTPSVGQQFTVVHNAAGTTSGQFNDINTGLPIVQNVTIFNVGGLNFSLTYHGGGSGQDVILTRVAVDSPPALVLGAPSGPYQGSPVFIAPSASLTDDNTTETSVTATITSSLANGGTLSASNAGHPSVSIAGNGTSSLTLTGGATVADYQAVIQSIQYSNAIHDAPSTTPITVDVTANDAGPGSTTQTATINVVHSTSVSSRLLFYHNSTRYDVTGPAGGRPVGPFSDDNAIATDKSAYLPNGTISPPTTTAATFASVSGYTLGINGVMVDLAGFHGTLTPADFIFRVGNNNTSTLWVAGPSLVGGTVIERPGAGAGGSDRFELIWADNSIKRTWLEVIVKGNDAIGGNDTNTGLAASDTFFFANSPGDSGLGDTTTFNVDSNDEVGARNNPKNILANIPATNVFDYNKDGKVDSADEVFARNNGSNAINAPKFIKIGVPPAAPVIDAGVGSGLTAAASVGSGGGSTAPTWLSNSLGVAIGSGKLDNLFRHLAEVDNVGSRRLLLKIDAVADELGIHDDVLDSLVEGLV